MQKSKELRNCAFRFTVFLSASIFALLILINFLPSPLAAWTQAREALGWGDLAHSEQLATALSALAIWACTGWCLAIITSIMISVLPGRLGQAAHAFGQAFAPALVRGFVAALLGISLAATPAAAAAFPEAHETSANVIATQDDLDWPMTRPTPQAPPPDHSHKGETVTVAPGDTLWSIAAKHLAPTATDAEIIIEWERWWKANRDTVGADPDLIVPGQVLRRPS